MSDLSPPPPSTLVDQLASLRPVRTRVPARALVIAATLPLAWAAMVLAVGASPLRHDLPGLPVGWLLGVAALWALGFFGSLAVAVLPPRGQVMPRTERAGWWAAATVSGAVLIALLLRHVGPASVWSPSPETTVVWSSHCFATSVIIAACPLALGLFALRRAVAVGERAVGAALGAAGGALGGLALHLHCSVVDLPHLALGHALPVAVTALAGALTARRLLVP